MVFFVESSETSHMCPICHSYHTELPDCLVPYKHYEAEVISGVLDEVVRPENLDSEDYPSLFHHAALDAVVCRKPYPDRGYLRTAGFHLLACGRGILFSKVSLLDAVSKKHSDWLERILRLIYNNGGFLVPIRW